MFRQAELARFVGVFITISVLTISLLVHGFATAALGQQISKQPSGAKTYMGKRGGRKVPITLPLGDISFADEVVVFEKGKPGPPVGWDDPRKTLSAPDYKSEADDRKNGVTCLTLGTGGQITLRFTNNALVDAPGPDLFVWEVGPMVESTSLDISSDGVNWVEVGKVEGATAEVDISNFVQPGEVFHYVRLTDRGRASASFPGADIDAVAAIGSALQLSLDSSVLFDHNKAILKPNARTELHKAAMKIKQYSSRNILVEGHTDNTGADDYNLKLSQDRAAAVREYLISAEGISAASIGTTGFGESRPIADNSTETGREQNRRVEIIVIPN